MNAKVENMSKQTKFSDFAGLSREFLLGYLLQEGEWSTLDDSRKMRNALALVHAEFSRELFKLMDENPSDIYEILRNAPKRTLSEEETIMWNESLPALINPVYPGDLNKTFDCFRRLLFLPGNRSTVLQQIRSPPVSRPVSLPKSLSPSKMSHIHNSRSEIQVGGDAKTPSYRIPPGLWNARFL